MKRLVFAIAIGMVTPITAQAADFNLPGSMLLVSCKASDGQDQGLCLSYIMGASMATDITMQSFATDKARRCTAPPGSDPKTLRDAVIRHLENHPSDQSAPAALSVILAERELWPCR